MNGFLSTVFKMTERGCGQFRTGDSLGWRFFPQGAGAPRNMCGKMALPRCRMRLVSSESFPTLLTKSTFCIISGSNIEQRFWQVTPPAGGDPDADAVKSRCASTYRYPTQFRMLLVPRLGVPPASGEGSGSVLRLPVRSRTPGGSSGSLERISVWGQVI